MERRLAAILALDVVGYSRLMGADEVRTLGRLYAVHREVVSPAIAQRGGRVVKLMGDGLLAEFPSVVEAVASAIEIQNGMEANEPGIEGDDRINLRIGINLGDIIHRDSDIFGDGVNVAARLEGLADPGGICVSQTVVDHVQGKLDSRFEDLGEREVKNIERPVRVFRVVPASGAKERVAAVPKAAQQPTVAVLPFQNLSGEPEQSYFSDGITEDLITEISRFRGLSVISRNSSFAFRDETVPVSEIGRKLGARYIVEGSVRRSGQRVRITAQLIDAMRDNHVWAERYDREMAEIFEVQDDVVRHVASTMVDRLEFDGVRRTEHRSEDQLRAYDLYLRGREHFFNWSMAENRRAAECLRAALRLEPDNAAALALHSEIVLREWLNGWSTDPDRDLAEAMQLARRADELDAQDSRTQTALGMAYLFHRDLNRARYHFETGLRINPNDTRVLVYYSRQAVFAGETDRAIALCESGHDLNPFGRYNWNLAIAYFVARRYDMANEALEAIRNPPETVLSLLAASYAMAGRDANARRTYELFAEKSHELPMTAALIDAAGWRAYFHARWPFADEDNFEHLMAALAKAGLPS